MDATADQFGPLWTDDPAVINANDNSMSCYLPNPRGWTLRPGSSNEAPTELICTSGDDERVVHAHDVDHPWPALTREVLRVVTGWDLNDQLVAIAARALRAKLATATEASTDHLIRPLVTESIQHFARTSPAPWIAAEFREPL